MLPIYNQLPLRDLSCSHCIVTFGMSSESIMLINYTTIAVYTKFTLLLIQLSGEISPNCLCKKISSSLFHKSFAQITVGFHSRSNLESKISSHWTLCTVSAKSALNLFYYCAFYFTTVPVAYISPVSIFNSVLCKNISG